jgi:hypothetical protein
MPALRGERRPADAATIDGAELRTRIAVRRAELEERYEFFEPSAFDVD